MQAIEKYEDACREAAQIAARIAQRGGHANTLFDPAELYGVLAFIGLDGAQEKLGLTAADFADAIRLTALKHRAGDLEFVRKTWVGELQLLDSLITSTMAQLRGLTEVFGYIDRQNKLVARLTQLVKTRGRTLIALVKLADSERTMRLPRGT